MGQGIQVCGGCILWLGSGSRSWRRQKPSGILLVLFYQTEENPLSPPTAQFSGNEAELCSKNSELLTIPFPSNGAPEKLYCPPLLSRSLLTPDPQAWIVQRNKVFPDSRKLLQGIGRMGAITVSSATQKEAVGQ